MKHFRFLATVIRTPLRSPHITRRYSARTAVLQQQQPTIPENMASIPKGEESVPEPPTVNNDATPIAKAEKEEKPLPKLSAAEFRQYNRMAEHMDYFHNNFRQTWEVLYGACEAGKRPKNMSIRQFISTGQQFCHHLTVHHTIEEQHIFPILAKKMPAFKKELELLTQHKQIHNGLDKLEKYLEECNSGERELRLGEMKEILEGFGEVLWQHLDDEVKQLEAENMRKYWSLEEMRRIPM